MAWATTFFSDVRQPEVAFFLFIFGRWFCPDFQSNRLCKSKEAKQYKFYIVKACEQGKGLTSGWRPSLKKAFVKLTVRELKLKLGL